MILLLKGISQKAVANNLKSTVIETFVVKKTRQGPKNAAFTTSVPQCTGSPRKNVENSR